MEIKSIRKSANFMQQEKKITDMFVFKSTSLNSIRDRMCDMKWMVRFQHETTKAL